MHPKQYKIQHLSSTIPILKVHILGKGELLEQAS